jgi:IclR family transcriptional regulator, acetate operon repressor
MVNKQPDAVGDVERDVTGPRSLARLMKLFDVLSQAADGLSLAELNVALDTPKSSLLNLLRPLVADGYLLHSEGTYRLGPSIFRLSAAVLAAWNFPKLIRPYMEELSRRTGETVLLGVVNRTEGMIMYVEIIDSPHPVRYQVPVGTIRSLYATTAGRLLLAYSDKKWRDEYVATTTFKAKTAVPVTRASLKRELDKIRADGLSCSLDAYMKGLASVAVPVFDADGQCVASLNIAGPTERFQRNLEFLKATAKEVAEKASGVALSVYGV